MKKPAKTCKVKVSPGVYADWLAWERGWTADADGTAVQGWVLVGEYIAPKGFKGAGLQMVGKYEARRPCGAYIEGVLTQGLVSATARYTPRLRITKATSHMSPRC